MVRLLRRCLTLGLWWSSRPERGRLGGAAEAALGAPMHLPAVCLRRGFHGLAPAPAVAVAPASTMAMCNSCVGSKSGMGRFHGCLCKSRATNWPLDIKGITASWSASLLIIGGNELMRWSDTQSRRRGYQPEGCGVRCVRYIRPSSVRTCIGLPERTSQRRRLA